MNNEEQILLMLQGLIGDVQGLKGDVQGLKGDVQGLKGDVHELKEESQIIRTAVAKIEIEHGAKLQAVIDAQIAYEERFDNHEPRIVKLENKADRHDVELAHLLRKAE